ncbi:MAG TPA: TetR/AcrR family transcriptional regulator C-terminal domain-containing protein [Candidatus Acidoferrum sp.]|nr:TetR/AcrR family transcriptional regulator C-terminal domain-containing protein [Candidatus Acidoferrum sp.]
MATRPKRAAKRRPALTRDRVLRTAISLADRDGIDLLSMRHLGGKLGVEAMSLYNHVRNKDDMLDGMIDVVFSEIDLPPTGADWRTAMRQRAISAHHVLLRHPWAIALMESRATPGPANLRHHDAVLGSLRAAGFSVDMTAHAYSILDGYIYGFTMTESRLPFSSPQEVKEVAGSILEGFRPGEYPHLAEMAVDRAMKPGFRYGSEFEYGLDLILDGIERAQA